MNSRKRKQAFWRRKPKAVGSDPLDPFVETRFLPSIPQIIRSRGFASIACLKLQFFLSGHSCLHDYLRRYN